MSAFLNPYLAQFSTAMSFDLLRRLQGEFEVRLCELQAERVQAGTVRELVNSAQVLQMLQEAVDHCRSLIRAKRRTAGWGHLHSPARPGACLPSPVLAGRDAPVSLAVAGTAADVGVTGAKPLVMGQGWPAPVRAGSAARSPGRSGNEIPLPQEAAAHPGKALSRLQDEGISCQNNDMQGIHYAHFQR